MRTAWAEQVGGTASTDTVLLPENVGQLGSGAKPEVLCFNQLTLKWPAAELNVV